MITEARENIEQQAKALKQSVNAVLIYAERIEKAHKQLRADIKALIEEMESQGGGFHLFAPRLRDILNSKEE